MSLNCTDLVLRSTIVENALIGHYLSNVTGSVIYLEEDVDSFFGAVHWYNLVTAKWLQIGTLCVVIYILMCSLIWFPLRMRSQKQTKLRVLASEGIVDYDTVLPLINAHIDGAQDISNLILQFAGTQTSFHFEVASTFEHGSASFDFARIQTVRDIDDTYLQRRGEFASESVCQSAWRYRLYFLLNATLFYAGFIPLYLVSNHWNVSNFAFLKTECALYGTDSSDPDHCCESPSTSQTEIDILSLCSADTMDDAAPYTFYVKTSRYGNARTRAEAAFYDDLRNSDQVMLHQLSEIKVFSF